MLTPDRPLQHGYSIRELQTCAEREVRLRRQIYPNRVLTHRMSPRQADSEIDKMMAIAEMLREMANEMAERERLL